MSETREAGALILSQLEMFNETVKLYEAVIQPEVFESMEKLVIEATEGQGWIGGYYESNSEIWLAPEIWNAAESSEDPALRAGFTLVNFNEEDDSYLIAALCGYASASAGFKFFIDTKAFGGKPVWNKNFQAWAEKSPKSIQNIQALGFRDLGKGEFFLPVQLDAEELSNAYRTNDFEVALEPLQNALEIIKHSQKLFDQILNDAPSNG
ncbi:hypothetical protein [Deefgea salmonis]|uniref:Uncharacterized protein n=1 Tax=Deefgea salmonis TaxID=2875502 RepID=A0ABS8BJ00_9NEIS|nr:hypothetical protein [Deefgea salmonis]MCB5195692.1 hypothetical protein [Deefgea salmonis]